MKVVVKMIISPLERLTHLITISICHICGTEAEMLCSDCRDKTFPELDSRCYKCNKITSQNVCCQSCRSGSRLRRVWWLGQYKFEIKNLVRDMKFKRRRSCAREFGAVLAETLPFLPEETLVVPIPTASGRVRKRGFDQAKIIAKVFAHSRGLKYCEALVRTTQVDQIGKRRSDRIAQMQNSLIVSRPAEILGASVLLIDDVLTTGATLEVAAGLLRDQGALHVDAAVIARHLLG